MKKHSFLNFARERKGLLFVCCLLFILAMLANVGLYFSTGDIQLTGPQLFARIIISITILLVSTGAFWFDWRRENILVDTMYENLKKETELIAGPREFYIDTPLGTIKVYAKNTDTDNPKDYPGVFIDFENKDGISDFLTCVEYDPCKNKIQTCVYGSLSQDEPTNVTVHELL